MALQEKPFVSLFNRFVCIVAVRDRELGLAITRTLQNLPLVQVIPCSSAAQAEAAITERKSVHCCICGAGLDDSRGDELYLLKRFGDHIPFVMCLAGERAELSAECVRFDAASILMQNRCGPESDEFVICVCNQIVKGVLFPLQSLRMNRILHHSLEILFRREPKSVSDWADLCGMSRRYLCTLWRTHCGSTAHKRLLCFDLLCAAFSYYLNELLDRSQRNTSQESLKKQRLLSRKYFDHLQPLHQIMFPKHNYGLLPVRRFEQIGFYDAPDMPRFASHARESPKHARSPA